MEKICFFNGRFDDCKKSPPFLSLSDCVRFYEFIILLFDYKVKIEQDNSYNIKKILINA